MESNQMGCACDNVETVGDLRKKLPALVKEIELTAKAEAEKSIAAEVADLKAKIEQLEKDLLAAQTEVDEFNRIKAEAKADAELNVAKDAIKKELVEVGADMESINETLLEKYARLGDEDMTKNFVESNRPKKQGVVRDKAMGKTSSASNDEYEAMLKRRLAGG